MDTVMQKRIKDQLWVTYQYVGADLEASSDEPLDWETVADVALDKFESVVFDTVRSKENQKALVHAFRSMSFDEQETIAKAVFKGRV